MTALTGSGIVSLLLLATNAVDVGVLLQQGLDLLASPLAGTGAGTGGAGAGFAGMSVAAAAWALGPRSTPRPGLPAAPAGSSPPSVGEGEAWAQAAKEAWSPARGRAALRVETAGGGE